MKKLILNEDDDIEIVDKSVDDPVDNSLSLSTMINSMIKGEWDAIDLYNAVYATIDQMNGNEDALATIKDIVEEEYIHVGQLEKLLQSINPSAENINDGAVEAENDLEEPDVE